MITNSETGKDVSQVPTLKLSTYSTQFLHPTIEFQRGVAHWFIAYTGNCKSIIPKEVFDIIHLSACVRPTALRIHGFIGRRFTLLGKSIIPVRPQRECISNHYLVTDGCLSTLGLNALRLCSTLFYFKRLPQTSQQPEN